MNQQKPATNTYMPDAGIASLIESLSMLRGLVQTDAQPYDEARICQNAVDTCVEHRDIEASALYLHYGDYDECAARACRSVPNPATSNAEIEREADDEKRVKDALSKRAAVSLPDLSTQDYPSGGSAIVAPISVHGALLGALIIRHSSSYRYAAWHERLLVLCSDLLGRILLNGRLLRGHEDTIDKRTRQLSEADATLRVERQLRSAAELAVRKESRLRTRQAMTDPLTGLRNRHGFKQRLRAATSRASADGVEYCLLLVDIDRFKIINDVGGHIAGDRLVQSVADLLQRHFAHTENLARLGNDEFAILLEDHTAEAAVRRGEALCNAVDAMQFNSGGQRFVIGISVGVVSFPRQGVTSDELLLKANAACFTAQDQGGGNVQLYKESDGRMQRRGWQARSLAQFITALEEGRLELFCQPIVASRSVGEPAAEQLADHEILVRMRDVQGELISPGQFLPIAERFGLSVRLDRWVVENTLATFNRHPTAQDKLGHLTINLSGHSIGNQEFLEYIIERLHTSGIPPHKVCFEVTETVAISNLRAAREFIVALKDMGCRFALDDFGSGHASYLYLRDLPADFLKIDGEFVQKIATDPVSLALVRSIDDIGKITGKKTIAEYVENDATLNLLKDIGVDYLQGYFIGRPVSLDTMLGGLGV